MPVVSKPTPLTVPLQGAALLEAEAGEDGHANVPPGHTLVHGGVRRPMADEQSVAEPETRATTALGTTPLPLNRRSYAMPT